MSRRSTDSPAEIVSNNENLAAHAALVARPRDQSRAIKRCLRYSEVIEPKSWSGLYGATAPAADPDDRGHREDQDREKSFAT